MRKFLLSLFLLPIGAFAADQICHDYFNCPVLYSDKVKPCAGADCPLPPNLDYLISCCANSKTDREKFIIIFQKREASRQDLIATVQALQAKKAISPEAIKLVNDQLAWESSWADNKQIKDWPSKEERDKHYEEFSMALNKYLKTDKGKNYENK